MLQHEVRVDSGPSRPRRSRKWKGIIVHAIGEWISDPSFGGEHFPAWDYLDQIGLSAHAFVTTGGTLVRQVPDTRVAFHAGDFNWDHLGIEVCVQGLHNISTLHRTIKTDWMLDLQMAPLVRQVSLWSLEYDIPTPMISPHSAVDVRKKDPGTGFPWERFIQEVESEKEKQNGSCSCSP